MPKESEQDLGLSDVDSGTHRTDLIFRGDEFIFAKSLKEGPAR